MKIKELIEVLSSYDDENMEVLIDDSIDGFLEDVRELEEWDIRKYDDNSIIFNYKT